MKYLVRVFFSFYLLLVMLHHSQGSDGNARDESFSSSPPSSTKRLRYRESLGMKTSEETNTIVIVDNGFLPSFSATGSRSGISKREENVNCSCGYAPQAPVQPSTNYTCSPCPAGFFSVGGQSPCQPCNGNTCVLRMRCTFKTHWFAFNFN